MDRLSTRDLPPTCKTEQNGPFGTGNAGNFYIGLDYSPTFSKVRDFNIREAGGETKGVFPYLKDGKRVEFKSSNFNWNSPDPRIGFQDNMLLALEGSVGYGMGGARVEIEVGYERFPIQGVSGGKGDDGDAVFLLAKELANDVVRNKTDKLSAAIQTVARKDMHRFSNTINIDYEKAAKGICTKIGNVSGSGNVDEAAQKTELQKPKLEGCACSDVTRNNDTGGICQTKSSASGAITMVRNEEGLKKAFGTGFATSIDRVDGQTSKQIAEDVAKLERDEKSKVASAFAKTIEGAEVVETAASVIYDRSS